MSGLLLKNFLLTKFFSIDLFDCVWHLQNMEILTDYPAFTVDLLLSLQKQIQLFLGQIYTIWRLAKRFNRSKGQSNTTPNGSTVSSTNDNKLFSRLLINPFSWQTEPNFVGSFDIGEYVYFFFRESAVEYINCGKNIYSRVARVCKVGVQ